MQEKINNLLKQNDMSFGELAKQLGVGKHTLTKKVLGEMDWTFPEMTKLIELFQIEDPQSFFFD